MRHAIPAVVIGLCALIANPAAPDRDPSSATDISGAKKKKPRYHVIVRRAPPVYVARPWADPSFGPDGRPYRNPYPPNECSTDEGYGRFSPCTFRN